MYYILNHSDQIIAADVTLLKFLDLENIEALTKEIIFNQVKITSLSADTIQIHIKNKVLNFTSKTISLHSILGNLNLVCLTPTDKTQKNNDIVEPLEEIEQDFSTLTISTTPNMTLNEITLDTVNTEHNLSFIKNENEKKDFLKSRIFTLEPIVIPINKISNQIGISIDDYNIFLDEYIDSALSLELDLKNTNTKIRSKAIKVLTQLADVLHLPQVNETLSTIDTQSSTERNKAVKTFYNILTRLTTEVNPINFNIEKKEEKDSNQSVITPQKSKKIKNTLQDFGTLDLNDVKPIKFHFQLEEVANDLMLPIELIEEFIHDFIQQAHSETKKMLTAYKEGDINTIQKIGHLLKGASSNLRINALSDTLFQIQSCEEHSKLEKLIKQYWGQFLSFEIHILSK